MRIRPAVRGTAREAEAVVTCTHDIATVHQEAGTAGWQAFKGTNAEWMLEKAAILATEGAKSNGR